MATDLGPTGHIAAMIQRARTPTAPEILLHSLPSPLLGYPLPALPPTQVGRGALSPYPHPHRYPHPLCCPVPTRSGLGLGCPRSCLCSQGAAVGACTVAHQVADGVAAAGARAHQGNSKQLAGAVEETRRRGVLWASGGPSKLVACIAALAASSLLAALPLVQVCVRLQLAAGTSSGRTRTAAQFECKANIGKPGDASVP